MSRAEKTPMDTESPRTRQQQTSLFAGLAAAALFAFAVWISAGGGGGPPPPRGIEAEPAGPETAETGWARRTEARIGALAARLRELEARFREENAELRARLARNAEDSRMVINRQAAAIDDLRRRLKNRASAPGAEKGTERGRVGSFGGDPALGP